MRKLRKKYWLYLIAPPLASLIVSVVVFVNATQSHANAQEQPAKTPTATSTPLPPTPTPFIQFGGKSVLNDTQPIMSYKYEDVIYDEDGNPISTPVVKLREVGLESGTNFLIVREKIVDTGEYTLERYGTNREANAYNKYVRDLERKEAQIDRENMIQSLKTRVDTIQTLNSTQKDQLLKDLAYLVLEIVN